MVSFVGFYLVVAILDHPDERVGRVESMSF